METALTLNLVTRIQELEKEIEVLRWRAERDSLTGCFRREAFMEIIQKRRRFGLLPQKMTLVIADIDHFKKINDTHGHHSGDQALKVFAECLINNAGNGSLVCRMGGEEFVMLIPGDLDQNRETLETLRKKVEELQLTSHQGRKIAVTASFGAVNWNSDEEILRASVEADQKLYQAKNGGRNRVAA